MVGPEGPLSNPIFTFPEPQTQARPSESGAGGGGWKDLGCGVQGFRVLGQRVRPPGYLSKDVPVLRDLGSRRLRRWWPCCRANMAHTRQSRPDSSIGFWVRVVTPFDGVPSLLESGALRFARNLPCSAPRLDCQPASILQPSPCTLHPTPYTHTLHLTPYTLHPAPYTLHPTPYTLQPAPYNLHLTPFTLHSTPCTLHSTTYNLHPTTCTLHPTPYTLHPTPCTLHPTPYTLHPTSYTLHPTP
jgi:hypothetical protein